MKLTRHELQNLLNLSNDEPQWCPAKLLEAIAWGLLFGLVAWGIWKITWIVCGPWACPGTGN